MRFLTDKQTKIVKIFSIFGSLFLGGLILYTLLPGIIFLLFIFFSDSRTDKKDIFAFVQENQEFLLDCIEADNFSEFENHEIIKEIERHNETIDFSCGGFGIAPSSAYCGFYYSPNDSLVDVWCAPVIDEEDIISDDKFEWQDSGDNTYYAEKICDSFYYYTASF